MSDKLHWLMQDLEGAIDKMEAGRQQFMHNLQRDMRLESVQAHIPVKWLDNHMDGDMQLRANEVFMRVSTPQVYCDLWELRNFKEQQKILMDWIDRTPKELATVIQDNFTDLDKVWCSSPAYYPHLEGFTFRLMISVMVVTPSKNHKPKPVNTNLAVTEWDHDKPVMLAKGASPHHVLLYHEEEHRR